MNEIRTKILQRLIMLQNLGEDHGGEGEHAPNQKSFEYAIDFLSTQHVNKPFLTTVDHSTGYAVFEFHDMGHCDFADVTFLDDGTVSCYQKISKDTEGTIFDTHYASDKFTVFFHSLVS